MRKQKTYLHLMIGILVLLFGCRAGYLQASDQPEKASAEVAMARDQYSEQCLSRVGRR